MAQHHHENFESGNHNPHGLGDIARRNAESDYREQFGSGRRTQNMPEDYGTARSPEPFDRGYRDEAGRFDERYGERSSGSRFTGRGWSGGPRNESPGWRGDAGLGRAYSGDYESLQRSGAPDYGERSGREQSHGYRGRGPKNYTRSDERIQENICERLWDAADVDASDVMVDVKDGVVTLRGNVEQRRIKHRIEDIADACGGVKDIRNEIRVQPRNEWPYDKGVAPGSTGGSAGRPEEEAGQNEGMIQSAVENMPPRSH